MAELYHPAIHDTARPVDSHWAASAGPEVEGCAPLESDESCDVAVIGGGYTGLSAALHMARDHGLDVRVLEAGPPGWGASGRNGGFCCLGGAKLSERALERRFGLDETKRFHRAQIESVELVREIAAAEQIDIDATGEGEIAVAHKPSRVAGLAKERDIYRRNYGLRAELWSREELAARGVAGPEAFAALHVPVGFGLHPLKYARGLARAAMARGARVHAGSRVEAWSRDGGRHHLATAGGSLSARRVIVATNGFTSENLHPGLRGTLLPVLSAIATTRPLSEDELAAQGLTTTTPIFDTRDLLYYFRLLPDRRFMLGARGGTSAAPGGEGAARAWMAERLAAMFPAWAGIEIERYWRGLLCMSADRLPHVGAIDDDPSVFHALAYHGNGVAMASWTGRAVAGLVAGANEPLPAVLSQPLRRFPVPALRMWYLRAAYAGYRFRDAVL